ncbi:MAG: elongation factor G, partial [Myxococcota bacterium]
GSATTDFLVEEQQSGITISSAAVTVDWSVGGAMYTINLIDTPGHVDFTIEVERSLRVLDGAVAVFDAVAGVEPQSETVWRQADRYGVPRIAFVNKLDRMGATVKRTLAMMRERLGATPVLLQIPVGLESDFRGVVDVLTRACTAWAGGEVIVGAPPSELADELERAREAAIEAIVEQDEALTERYLAGDVIEVEELRAALREATLRRTLVPVLIGSALKGRGVQPLLDAVVHYLPTPLDMGGTEGVVPETGEAVVRPPSEGAPLAALAFKVTTDKFGQLTFVRVYSGVLEQGAKVANVTRGQGERIARLVRVQAASRETIERAVAGDIVGVVGLKHTFTGDTLASAEHPVMLERIEAPEPVVWSSIEAPSNEDRARLGEALRRVGMEDPSFRVRTDEETGQTVVGGMGELHLQVVGSRICREFGVAAELGRPRVALRETITKAVEHRVRLKKMSGGPGMFAEVMMRLKPGKPGSGIVFDDVITQGAVSKQYIPAVEQGVREATESGPVAEYPVTDVHVTLLDGMMHEVDSSEMA